MSYDRHQDDYYIEPAWAVEALLDAERFVGTVLDPAAGGGNIVEVCRARGLNAWGSDRVDRGSPVVTGGIDFLALPTWSQIDNIICNPPFALAEEFVRRALTVARYKVAMLVRLAFLESQSRKEMFESTPLARVLVFASRVSMPPGGRGIKAKGGKTPYCWAIWRQDHQGPPTLGWLP